MSVVATKKITQQYYGYAAKKNYYLGCSTAGRQGLKVTLFTDCSLKKNANPPAFFLNFLMKEAQMFPEDFDGIVSQDVMRIKRTRAERVFGMDRSSAPLLSRWLIFKLSGSTSLFKCYPSTPLSGFLPSSGLRSMLRSSNNVMAWTVFWITSSLMRATASQYLLPEQTFALHMMLMSLYEQFPAGGDGLRGQRHRLLCLFDRSSDQCGQQHLQGLR